MSDETTFLTAEGPDGRRRRAAGDVPCLVLAWARDEPDRIGEVVLPAPETATLGRAAGEGALELVRQQGADALPTGPLRSRGVSRAQLSISLTDGVLHVANVGRRGLRHNGVVSTGGPVAVGDVLELEDIALFVVVARPRRLAIQAVLPFVRFGEADEHGIVGESVAAWEMRARLAQVARRKGHALICGPSGTGKELVARALHRLSDRGAAPWVARNAATFPEGLIDAELFGNVRNYPNPGMRERPGLIGEADQGVLFLDEVGELPAAMQAHLLRVLDHGEYQRLGDAAVCHSAVRVIAATNRDVSALKDDFAARFPVTIVTTGLGERLEDVPLLVRHLLRAMRDEDPTLADRFFDGDHPRCDPDLIRHVLRWTWTTHVRQLQQILWVAVDQSRADRIELPPLAGDVARSESHEAVGLTPKRIQECLDRHNGRQSEAYKELGLSSRHQLARLIKRYGLVVRRQA